MKNSITYAPDKIIAEHGRILGWRDFFSLWFSLGIGLAVLQAGAVLSPGLGMINSGAGWRHRLRHRAFVHGVDELQPR
jgi:purine-cytosine permease-like protein